MNFFSLPSFDVSSLYYLAAFVGGTLSFFSPCTLPVLPLFLSYLAGVSLDSLKVEKRAQRQVFLHTLFFIVGLVVIYSLMGVIVGLLGAKLFVRTKSLFLSLSGLLIIIFGLYTLHLLKIPFFSRERRITIKFRKFNYLTSLVQGVVFALLWSPCTGPVLVGVLFMAETFNSIQESTLTMLFFTLGISLPLILTGLLTSKVAVLIRRRAHLLRVVDYFAGLFLIVIGVLLLTRNFELFTRLTTNFMGVLMD